MDVISYLLENMKEVFFIICEQFFCFQHNIHNSPPHPFFLPFLSPHTHQELNVGALCFASENGKFDLAQFLISKNCPINGVHNQFVFSFFLFFFQKLWKFFSLCLLQSFITTVKSITSGSCMFSQQFGYCRIIITKWSTFHCSSLLVFLITFFKIILSFFFLFFLSIYHQFGFGKTGKEYSSSSLWFLFC